MSLENNGLKDYLSHATHAKTGQKEKIRQEVAVNNTPAMESFYKAVEVFNLTVSKGTSFLGKASGKCPLNCKGGSFSFVVWVNNDVNPRNSHIERLLYTCNNCRQHKNLTLRLVEEGVLERKNPDVTDQVLAALDKLDNESKNWTGRSGPVDYAVMLAHILIYYQCGKEIYTASCRQIARLMGISKSAVQRSNKRLAAMNWISDQRTQEQCDFKEAMYQAQWKYGSVKTMYLEPEYDIQVQIMNLRKLTIGRWSISPEARDSRRLSNTINNIILHNGPVSQRINTLRENFIKTRKKVNTDFTRDVKMLTQEFKRIIL